MTVDKVADFDHVCHCGEPLHIPVTATHDGDKVTFTVDHDYLTRHFQAVRHVRAQGCDPDCECQ